VACGSTGEAATLDEDEWLDGGADRRRSRSGPRSGLGRMHPQLHANAGQAAEKLARIRGVDAVLSANPYYNKPTQEGQYQHFMALAEPLTHAGRALQRARPYWRESGSGDGGSAGRDAPNIAASRKPAASCPRLPRWCIPCRSGFKVFSGDDNLALAAIGTGANGLISVASNEAPAELTRMVRAALRNEWPLAREIERKYARLFEANFWESNPGPAKTILSHDGPLRCYGPAAAGQAGSGHAAAAGAAGRRVGAAARSSAA
jgi:4-hydroxy-tetrahydrodipicolinate synthase